jgi:hypothetical protein
MSSFFAFRSPASTETGNKDPFEEAAEGFISAEKDAEILNRINCYLLRLAADNRESTSRAVTCH